jgi:hypothetical protein
MHLFTWNRRTNALLCFLPIRPTGIPVSCSSLFVLSSLFAVCQKINSDGCRTWWHYNRREVIYNRRAVKGYISHFNKAMSRFRWRAIASRSVNDAKSYFRYKHHNKSPTTTLLLHAIIFLCVCYIYYMQICNKDYAIIHKLAAAFLDAPACFATSTTDLKLSGSVTARFAKTCLLREIFVFCIELTRIE